MSKNRLVVKDNALIDASFVLDLVEQRLILMAIVESRDKGISITSDTLISIHASSYMHQFPVEKSTAYEALKSASNTLFRRYFTYTDMDDVSGKKRVVKSHWVSKIAYIDDSATIQICFSPDVIPLIAGLKQRFTRYEIKQISKFTSAYAIRMYEMLIKWQNSPSIPAIELPTLRVQLGVQPHEYSAVSDLKKRVIDVAIKQINLHSDICVTYEQVKSGRTITHLKFDLKQKNGTQKTIIVDREYITENALAYPGESWEEAIERVYQKLKAEGLSAKRWFGDKH